MVLGFKLPWPFVVVFKYKHLFQGKTGFFNASGVGELLDRPTMDMTMDIGLRNLRFHYLLF